MPAMHQGFALLLGLLVGWAGAAEVEYRPSQRLRLPERCTPLRFSSNGQIAGTIVYGAAPHERRGVFAMDLDGHFREAPVDLEREQADLLLVTQTANGLVLANLHPRGRGRPEYLVWWPEQDRVVRRQRGQGLLLNQVGLLTYRPDDGEQEVRHYHLREKRSPRFRANLVPLADNNQGWLIGKLLPDGGLGLWRPGLRQAQPVTVAEPYRQHEPDVVGLADAGTIAGNLRAPKTGELVPFVVDADGLFHTLSPPDGFRQCRLRRLNAHGHILADVQDDGLRWRGAVRRDGRWVLLPAEYTPRDLNDQGEILVTAGQDIAVLGPVIVSAPVDPPAEITARTEPALPEPEPTAEDPKARPETTIATGPEPTDARPEPEPAAARPAEKLPETREPPAEEQDERISLNHASPEQLQTLPRIGPVLSQRIIEGRPYGQVDDLLRVYGIGEKTLERLRPLVRP